MAADNKVHVKTASKFLAYNSSVMKQMIQRSSQSTGINVHLYTDHDADQDCINFMPKFYTAEALCLAVTEVLDIGVIAFPIFALRRKSGNEEWLAPNELISCNEDTVDELMFRVRFVPPNEQLRKLMEIDRNAFDYLFLQVRFDFIHGNIVYSGKGFGQDQQLGMGVIDMVRFGLERQLELSRLQKQDPHQFIPKETKDGFKYPWDKYRLQKNFSPYMEKEYKKYSPSRSDSSVGEVGSIKTAYVDGILKAANHYGSETFSAIFEKLPVEIYVRPYDEKYPGILIQTAPNPFHSDIKDLVDIIISEYNDSIRVQINRKTGVPHMFFFDSRCQARSFVSLLDGHYRLQHDYHYCLCSEVTPPSLLQLKDIKCHGPVPKDWARDRLIERHRMNPSWNYLLKLSRRKRGQYVITYIKPVVSSTARAGSARTLLSPEFYPVEQAADGQLYLEIGILFKTIQDLLNYYREATDHNAAAAAGDARTNGVVPDVAKIIQLKRCVPPINPLSPRLYICRPLSSDTDVDSGPMSDGSRGSARSQITTRECRLIPSVKHGELLGEGLFTLVYKTLWNKDSRTSNEAAVKYLRPEYLTQQQYFSESMNRALFWSHSTIVTIHAVCLATPMSVVMERAVHGSLVDYLQLPLHDLKNYHLVVAAEYIAQALCYLEERDLVHGNICCRNILLFNHEPKDFLVKLADPGMIYLTNQLPLDHDFNTARLPWLAPECYADLKAMTLESDRYAYGTTLYEMFSTGQPLFPNMIPNQIRDFVLSGKTLDQPQYCPDVIFNNVIKRCWTINPEERISPLDIVREIRRLKTNDCDIYSDYSDPSWVDPDRTPLNSAEGGGDSSVTLNHGSSVLSSVSSSAAAADNDINKRRLQTTLLHANEKNTQAAARRPMRTSSGRSTGIQQHQQLSPSTDSCDSRTPLLSTTPPTAKHKSTARWGGGVGEDGGRVRGSRVPLTVDTSQEFISLNTGSNVPLLGAGPLSGGSAQTNSTLVSADSRNHDMMVMDLNAVAMQSRPLPAVPTLTSLVRILTTEIKFDDRRKPLGQGHYGEVYKGTLKGDNGELRPVAIKCLKKFDSKLEQDFEKEMQIMVKLEHNNIVRIIGCHYGQGSNTRSLVMEYVENGCLRDYLKKKAESNSSLPPVQQLIQFGREIAQGMKYLSGQKIVHRDLAARNVLVTKDEHMKISDFGLSRCLGAERDYYKTEGSKELPAAWCAPEALSQTHRFSEKGDVWSFAVTLWEVFSDGKMPVLGTKMLDLFPMLEAGKRLEKPKRCPDVVYELMLKCWSWNPNDRDTFATVLEKMTKIEQTVQI